MPFVPPTSVSPGQVLTATRYNTEVVGNTEFLKSKVDLSSLEFIDSQPMGSTTARFLNCFTSKYKDYKIIGDGVMGSPIGNANILIARLFDGTNPINTNYLSVRNSNGTVTTETNAALLTGDGAGGYIFEQTISAPGLAAQTFFSGHFCAVSSTPTVFTGTTATVHTNATSYSGLELRAAAGLPGPGNFSIYGIVR
jgi:hypothetical protein